MAQANLINNIEKESERPQKKIGVLVCDDSLFMRNNIKSLIKKDHRFHVLGEARNGKEAVEKFIELKPDIVTMDLTMIGYGGIYGLENILKIDPSAKVIVCSSMGQQSLVMEALKKGAIDFIVKPFTELRLLQAVSAAFFADKNKKK